MKYDKQDQQAKGSVQRTPPPRDPETCLNRWQGAQEALKQKQDRAQCGARTGQSLIIK